MKSGGFSLILLVGASVSASNVGELDSAPDVSLLQASIEVQAEIGAHHQQGSPKFGSDWQNDLERIKAAGAIASEVYYENAGRPTVSVEHNGNTVVYTKAASWEQTVAGDSNTRDSFAIYKNDANRKCFLTIAGTDDVADVVDDIRVFNKISVCGIGGVAEGFGGEYLDFERDRPADFDATLVSNACAEVYITGHSLGGAVATILAACVQNTDIYPWKNKFMGVYTWGAPGTKENGGMTGPGGACLPGLRFYNVDESTMDPIPPLASVGGCKHPKMSSVQLQSHWCANPNNGWTCSYYTTHWHSCDSSDSQNDPGLELKAPNMGDHASSEYVRRLHSDLGGVRRRRRRWR